MAIDPICGMEVDEKAAEYAFVKNGKKHYFCSENCLNEFEESE
ncbi:YHS domain-containing protein [Candidatus Woesearchaeota archaeon]|nr:YHS domain-containing protein [Candidatus Woesearchaeota archaeon]